MGIEELIEKLEKSEEWRSVPGWGYEASDAGRLRNGTTRRLLLPSVTDRGYEKVTFQENYRRKTVRVHRAIYEAWFGPVPVGLQINHLDGNKRNNAPGNLEAVTNKQNILHAIASGLWACGSKNGSKTKPHRVARGERASLAKLTTPQVLDIRRRRSNGERLAPLANEFGVDQSLISLICRRRIWTHI